MTFKIYNFKLALIALILTTFLMGLGCWQLSRAKQKTALLEVYAERKIHPPITSISLNENATKEWRFYRATLTGHFDDTKTLLLDNKILNSKLGYEIYTVFHAKGLAQPILIDRGFVLRGENRKILPTLTHPNGEITITGLLNLPPAYFALGAMLDYVDAKQHISRIEYVNLTELRQYLHLPLFPYILILTPDANNLYQTEWQMVTIPPAKHKAYAFQWFALGFTLLILFLVLNKRAAKIVDQDKTGQTL